MFAGRVTGHQPSASFALFGTGTTFSIDYSLLQLYINTPEL